MKRLPKKAVSKLQKGKLNLEIFLIVQFVLHHSDRIKGAIVYYLKKREKWTPKIATKNS